MSSVEYTEMDTPEGKEWNKLYNPIFNTQSFVKIGQVKAVYPKGFVNFYDRIKDFKIKDDDIWVITFPKAGTTWVQEMVWCIMNELDFEKAKLNLEKRFPYFEMRALSSAKDETKIYDSFTAVEKLETPRLIKSHLHFSLLPNQLMREDAKAKMIITTRNPKDTCVSFYHHFCLLKGYTGTLEQFAKQFITDNVGASPYWTHLKEYWNIKNRNNIMFLKYEDMKQDLPSQIIKTAKFLGKSLSTDQVNQLSSHLSFENMKANPSVNHEDVVQFHQNIHGKLHPTKFLRKGQVDSWKEELSPEIIKMMDNWIKENGIPGLYDN